MFIAIKKSGITIIAINFSSNHNSWYKMTDYQKIGIKSTGTKTTTNPSSGNLFKNVSQGTFMPRLQEQEAGHKSTLMLAIKIINVLF